MQIRTIPGKGAFSMTSAFHIQDFVRMFYMDANIPVYHYRNGELLFAVPAQTPLTFPPDKYLEILSEKEGNVAYCSTDYGMYFIRLLINTSPGESLVFGPVCSVPLSAMNMHDLYADYVVPEEDRESINHLFWSIPQLTLNSFLSRILFLNYCLNGQCLSLQELLPLNESQHDTAVAENTFQAKEDFYHNKSYEIEQIISGYIKSGSPEKIAAIAFNDSQLHTGILAPTALRQLKNILIVSTTIFTRAAIEGGLDTDTAYRLSDDFIQAAEQSPNADYLNGLGGQAAYTFAAKVAQAQTPVSSDDIIQNAIRFIQQNTNRHITAADVAEHAGFSRSYFSSYFKKKLGFSIGNFITRCRLEEARYLLRYTSKPLSVISSYLCFSSQSHFQTAFKKQFGVTPMQFRRNPGH